MFPTQKNQVLPENEKFILFHESRQDRSVQERSVHARGKSQASGHEMYSLDITPTLSRTLSSKYHELSHELYHLNLTDCILSFTNRVTREEHPCPRPKPETGDKIYHPNHTNSISKCIPRTLKSANSKIYEVYQSRGASMPEAKRPSSSYSCFDSPTAVPASSIASSVSSELRALKNWVA